MTTMTNQPKIKQDILFYYWTGMILYITAAVLSVIHLYQLKGRVLVDFAFILFLLSINITLLVKIRTFHNWARKAYLVRLVIFALFFYPMLIFSREEWAYSRHWPHGVLQRVCNFSIVVFEIYFSLYLLRRSVRYHFSHAASDRADD
jgi:hypothetical protein